MNTPDKDYDGKELKEWMNEQKKEWDSLLKLGDIKVFYKEIEHEGFVERVRRSVY